MNAAILALSCSLLAPGGVSAWCSSNAPDAAGGLSDAVRSASAAADPGAALGATLAAAAAGDGHVDKDELYAAVMKLPSSAVADALRAVLPKWAAKLTPEALTMISQDWDASALQPFQELLYGPAAGAQLVDANLNGALDADDLLVAHGVAKPVGAELRDHLRIGEAGWEVGHEMANARLVFGAIHFNAAYWESFRGSRRIFQLKPGVKPSVALDDILAHSFSNSFDCATADVVFDYLVARKLLGNDAFDAAFKGMYIGPHFFDGALTHAEEQAGADNSPASAAFRADLMPGDYVYFDNPDVSDQAAQAGWIGENAHYIGKGLYYAHPFGIATEKQILDGLNGYRKDGSTTPATMVGAHRRITPAIFDLPAGS